MLYPQARENRRKFMKKYSQEISTAFHMLSTRRTGKNSVEISTITETINRKYCK
jgi:hypothetical protein